MSWTEAEHDRLLGLLAVKAGLIDPEALENARTATDPHATLLAERLPFRSLVARGVISGEAVQTLEAEARSRREEFRDDPGAALSTLACPTVERGPETVPVANGSTQTPMTTLADFAPSADNPPKTLAPHDPWATRLPGPDLDTDLPDALRVGFPAVEALTGHRYHRIRPHARGGLGEVFLAHDRELRREVALKEIQERHADHQENRARFVLEAEITGGLEHPGIVPVYGLGTYDDGRPYYAMRFIKGDSLREAIDQFHAEDGPRRDPGERALALRKLLQRFLDVCNAIAYAHSKGVLHRDLKPGNVMLGPFGETLVVDWGLAKVQGQPDLNLAEAQDAIGILSTLGSGSAETLPGFAMGTPQFMSPEQARGDLEAIGPASDVYSLGATLYALLTGRAPFEEKDIAQLLDKVRAGEFPAPRTINRRVPIELDAVCRKAMALDPAGRYPSARALAEDVEHWMADEPVVALPDTRAKRVHRWLRQHRIWAQSIAGTLVIVAAVSAVSAYLVSQERDKAHDDKLIALREKTNAVRAKEEADQARALAEEASAREAEARRAVASEKEKAVTQLYTATVGLAYQEWLTANIARAEELLAGCPERLRGWEWRHIKALCHVDLMTLREHAAGIYRLGYAADGTRFYTSDTRGVIKVWDAPTGQVLRSIPSETVGLAFDRVGKRMLAASNDPNTLNLWDLASDAPPRVLKAPGLSSLHAAFAPDNPRQLALVQGKYDLWIWDLEANSQLIRLPGRHDEALTIAYSPDGKLLAVGRKNGWLEVWELETRSKRFEIAAHPGEAVDLTRVMFSPDGRWLASSALDGTGKVWDAVDGRERFVLRGHMGFVMDLRYSPDGRRIATAGSDRTVRIWDANSGRELAKLRGHTGEVHHVAFSPDGRRLLSGSVDGTLKIWEARTGIVPPLAASSSAGEPLADEIPAERILLGHEGAVAALAFRPDGRRLATVGWDGRLVVHDLANGTTVLSIKDVASNLSMFEQLREVASGQHDPSVGSVAYSIDGRRIAVGGGGVLATRPGVVRILDAETGKPIRAISGLKGPVSTLAFAPDGRRLLVATGGVNATVVNSLPTSAIYDSDSGKLLAEYHGPAGAILDGAWSPDGRRVATASLNATIRIWDPADGKEIKILGRPGNQFDVFRGVAWSPDGTLVAAAGYDGGVRIYESASGQEIRKLRGHSEIVYRVAFHPDGRRLASTGRDATVKLWDVATGEELLTFRDHESEVYDLTFSADGRILASAGFDGVTRLRGAPDAYSSATEGWDVLVADDFNRATLGDRWHPAIGQWSIERGAARGVLKPSGTNIPYTWATLVPKGVALPSTVEVRFDVWSPSPIAIEAKLHDVDGFSGTRQGLGVLIAGKITPYNNGDPATSLIVQASGAFRDILTNPRVVFEKNRRRRVRLLREPRRLTVFVDGEPVVTNPVPALDVPFLHLQGGFGEPGDVVYIDDVEIRAPRSTRPEQQALARVEELFDREPTKPEVLARLEQETHLDPAVRSLALAIAGRRWQGAEELNRLSYAVSIQPDRPLDDYRKAVRRSLEALKQAPDAPGLVDSLGAAQYRAGQYPEALANLTKADQMAQATSKTAMVPNLAFQAMTLMKLGRKPEAEGMLEQVGAQVLSASWAQNPECPALRDEAEKVIGANLATARERTVRDLQAIGVAVHDYHEAHGTLPPAALTDASGRPLLSWRVALLPYLGQKELFNRFRLTEPWDSPANQALLAEIPKPYQSEPGTGTPAGSTRYRVFTGRSALFRGGEGTKVDSVSDGTVNTILAVEAADAVPWTKPDELVFDPEKPLPKLRVSSAGRTSLLLLDGSILTTQPTADAEATLKGMVTIDGGETIDRDRLPR
jgi:WD40 repeat protein/serine/threonine protein kinase/tetratricopeptide (TPR) repeat protein